MPTATYQARRGQIETYFDRTAADAWSRLTSDAPVSRIRATVRAGRDDMRATLLSWLPADLRGRRVLDAGCGTGALSVEAARRGAEVIAIDLSPTLVDLARERSPRDLGEGSIDFRVGDMLDSKLGRFDHVVAMDSLIHYASRDTVRVLAGLAANTDTSILFTFAPRTPALTAMHAVGRLFPRKDRAPAIEPVGPGAFARGVASEQGLNAWRPARTLRITSGFYMSQAMELVRAMTALRSIAGLNGKLARNWSKFGTRYLPFADVATAELPLGRLLRLSLFQVSVGMAVVLLIGTLNRVMIVELGVPAWLVAVMISLPLVFAPFRAVVGFRSDTHRSVLGWRRVPYIWMGTLIQFGGLAIMPFALLVLSGDTHGPLLFGEIGAALAFLLVGAGLHTVQTVGLALATDLAPKEAQPKVVALLCMMLLLGMIGSALLFGAALANFSELRLIQVIQAAAVATMVLNVVALWKQEARDPSRTSLNRAPVSFANAWRSFSEGTKARRQLVALGLGTMAFSMQDILLEPYGGQILHLKVGTTTALTAVLATGGMCGFGLAARKLSRGMDPYRLAAVGALVGLAAFSFVVFAAPLESIALFAIGVGLIGFGAGLFAHCTLTAAMAAAKGGQVGLVLGVWGAVQASAAGIAVAAGGLIRDGVSTLAEFGQLGPALNLPSTGYSVVYHIEIALLFATLIALGPLVRASSVIRVAKDTGFGIAEPAR